MSPSKRIAVTGLGSISPFGEGAETLWEGLISGATGVRVIQEFDALRYRSHCAALAGPFDPRRVIPASVLRRLDRTSQLAVPAAAEALDHARVEARERTGVILGTNSAGSIPVAEFLTTMSRDGLAAAPPILFPYTVANAPASQCALRLGLRGPNLTVVQKEGSSAGALSVACRMLLSGAAESLLAGGADDLSVHVFEAFDRLGVLSRDRTDEGGGTEGSRPFDRTRNGFVGGEASCLLHLETEDAALARGVEPLAFIEGIGERRSPIAPHRFPEDPAPLARAIDRAVDSARVSSDDIHAVFASANSSRQLDAVEAAALHMSFGQRVPPITSVRGAIGESGAGGAVSALAACFAMKRGVLPGTTGLVESDPDLRLDASGGNRTLAMDRVLVTGFSSGGSAFAVVLGAR